MKFEDYQTRARTTAIYQSSEYPFTNLFGEAGEVASKIAKIQRGDKVDMGYYKNPIDAINQIPELKAPIVKELGDVLWQLSACCDELNVTLQEVAQLNLDKLAGRLHKGTLKGEGDER